MTDLPTAVVLLGRTGAAGAERYRRAATARHLAVLVMDSAPGMDEPGGGRTDPFTAWTAGVAAAPAEIAALAPIQATEIVDQAATWSHRYDIRGVCPLLRSYGDAAALVADLLGLPSAGLRAAAAGHSADLQRRYLPEWSVAADRIPPNRRAAIVSGWTAFPAVVRPARQPASGSRVAGATELDAALRAYGPSERYVIEEEPGGRAYSVESLSRRGRLSHIRITTYPAHTPPGVTDSDRSRLTEAHVAVLTRLAFGTGAAHAVYHLDGERSPVLTTFGVGPSPVTEDATIEDAVIGLSLREDIVDVPGGAPVA